MMNNNMPKIPMNKSNQPIMKQNNRQINDIKVNNINHNV